MIHVHYSLFMGYYFVFMSTNTNGYKYIVVWVFKHILSIVIGLKMIGKHMFLSCASVEVRLEHSPLLDLHCPGPSTPRLALPGQECSWVF